MVPLTIEEELAYETIDSTNTLDKAFEPEGFLAGLVTDSDGDDDQSATMGAGSFLPQGVSVSGRFNRVEGFNAGLGYQKGFGDVGLSASAYSSYSFHSGFLNYGADVRQRLPFRFERPSIYLAGSYDNQILNSYSRSQYSRFMNSFQAVLGGVDYFDYYKQEAYSVGLEIRRVLSITDISIFFKSDRDQSLLMPEDAVYNYSLFGWHDKRPLNPPVFDGQISSLQMNVDLNRQSSTFGLSGSRQLRFSAERSSSWLGSDATFTKFGIEANWNMETFFGRRVFANTLDLQLTAGTLFGDEVPQRLGVVDGSLSGFTPFGTLKTRRNRPYAGSRYWSVFAEHNFRTVPFEILGLRALSDRGWGVILFGGAGYAGSDTNSGINYTVLETDNIHTEAGISLNSIFGILRIDFAKRLDAPGSYFGISVPRYF